MKHRGSNFHPFCVPSFSWRSGTTTYVRYADKVLRRSETSQCTTGATKLIRMTRVSSFYLRVKVRAGAIQRDVVLLFLRCSAKILQPAQWTLELNVTVFSYLLNLGSPKLRITGGTTRNNYLKSIYTCRKPRETI